MYTKEFILDEVNNIREEIGHDKVSISIEEIYCKNNEIWIITEDRPDKSAIIGKGGWVVGKLRERLGLESIHVESYGDFLNKEYKLKLSKKTIHNLDLNFVGVRNLERTIDYKLANIYSFNFDNFFEDHSFDLVIADLCLHYFDTADTDNESKLGADAGDIAAVKIVGDDLLRVRVLVIAGRVLP